MHSGAVGIEAMRVRLVLGELNNLRCCVADAGNACLCSKTKEKAHVVAGPEFGKLE